MHLFNTIYCGLLVSSILVTVFYSRKIIQTILEKSKIEPVHQEKSDIHNILNDRLLDIQNRKYSKRFRKENDV